MNRFDELDDLLPHILFLRERRGQQYAELFGLGKSLIVEPIDKVVRRGLHAFAVDPAAQKRSWRLLLRHAERVGFEPTDAGASTVFRTAAFIRSATSPKPL